MSNRRIALWLAAALTCAVPWRMSAQALVNDVNVLSFGAVGDGQTDSTVAFQQAIAAAEASGTNDGIYVPMGNYVLSDTLSLSQIEMVGKLAGGWPADTRPMPTLLIRHYNEPAVTLGNGSSIRGIAIYYDQGSPATTNAPAISLQGQGVTLNSVRFNNPYDAIDTPVTATPGRPRFSDLFIVSPVHGGIQISKCYDFAEFNHIEVWCPTNYSTGAAYSFGCINGGSFNGLLAYECTTAIQIYTDTSSGGGTFTGNFVNCCADACDTGVNISGNHQVKIISGDWDCEFWGIQLNGSGTQLSVLGGKWHANGDEAIMVNSGGNVLIDGCIFYPSFATSNPMVWISSCTTATVNSCQFLPTSAGLELDSGVQRAIITGNSFETGGITNNMTSSQQSIANNLLP